MTLSLFPLDILLVVFQELNVVDGVRIGMVSPLIGHLFHPQKSLQICKGLIHQATRDHHILVDKFDKLHQEYPVLKPATLPLTSLCVQELKSFAVHRTKL